MKRLLEPLSKGTCSADWRFTINNGKNVVLAASSGSGKTTLLKIMPALCYQLTEKYCLMSCSKFVQINDEIIVMPKGYETAIGDPVF